MITQPSNIQLLKSYKPGKTIEELVKELGLKKTAVLWNNENNLGPSPMAMKAVQEELSNSNLYSDPLSLKLRAKIAGKLGKNPENICTGNGSEGLLMNILKAFCGKGDEVLTSEGTFVIIYVWCQILNIPCIKVPLKDDYSYDLKKLAKRITRNTKLIYLSNINNPTGTMISRQELEDFLKIVPNNVLVLVDEAYFEFSQSLSADFPDSTKHEKSNLITLRTFSKSYGIAGNRIGYGIADGNIIDVLNKVKLTFEPSNISQAAGTGALDDEDYLSRTLKNNRDGISLFYKTFDELGLKYIPSFGNFVMLDFKTEEKANSVFEKLMKKGVFVRPLVAFGLPHCIRVSIGRPEENDYFIESLKTVLEELPERPVLAEE